MSKKIENEKAAYYKKNWTFTCLRALPLIINLLLLFLAFINFMIKYVFSADAEYNIQLVTSFFFSKNIFYTTFFAFFIIDIISNVILLNSSNFFLKIIFIITAFISSSFMAFSIPDLFSIKMYTYLTTLICICICCSPVIDIAVSVAVVMGYMAIITYPLYGEITETWTTLLIPSVFDLINCTFLFIMTILCSITYKKLILKLIQSTETIKHINTVMNQMTVINSQLQEYAKTHGEEAVKNERMRITRDMHDSCGYTFVNITAIMDALMSTPSISKEDLDDSLLTVRNLASKGLKETRKTLHSIREIASPMDNNIEAIFETKKVFSIVTGINVDIATGNIKKNYGQTINAIIIHTMQEALTNSVRHGRAKNINVALWEEKGILTMTVTDDGIGAKDIVKGIGFAGMEERISKVNGSLDFTSPKHGGFKLEIKIPLLDINNPDENFEKYSTGEFSGDLLKNGKAENSIS